MAEVAALVDAGRIRTTANASFGTINAANLRRAHALIESGARGQGGAAGLLISTAAPLFPSIHRPDSTRLHAPTHAAQHPAIQPPHLDGPTTARSARMAPSSRRTAYQIRTHGAHAPQRRPSRHVTATPAAAQQQRQRRRPQSSASASDGHATPHAANRSHHARSAISATRRPGALTRATTDEAADRAHRRPSLARPRQTLSARAPAAASSSAEQDQRTGARRRSVREGVDGGGPGHAIQRPSRCSQAGPNRSPHHQRARPANAQAGRALRPAPSQATMRRARRGRSTAAIIGGGPASAQGRAPTSPRSRSASRGGCLAPIPRPRPLLSVPDGAARSASPPPRSLSDTRQTVLPTSSATSSAPALSQRHAHRAALRLALRVRRSR